MIVRYILSIVCLRLCQFPQLSFMQYMGLCVFSLPIYLLMIVRICVLYLIIITKSEVWPICHCVGLGHEAMVCAVCISIFLWHDLTIEIMITAPIISQDLNHSVSSRPLCKLGPDAVNNMPVLLVSLCPANETRRYKVTPSLIGWANLESALYANA